MTYDVRFVREGLGWAVASIDPNFNVETSAE